MHTYSIDIETFSSVSLPDCGVYKYAESPDFTILLFGYSIDGAPVRVIDFASGEKMPDELYDALYDSNYEKWAYNAPFEMTCIGRFFDRPVDPNQWHCSLVLGSMCGLPLSLKAIGEALELGEDKAKMKEGSDLIRYFCMPCKPTKANDHRTRNLPEHAPEKWEIFKAYNKRDVEVECTIRDRLLKWRPEYSEHKLWVLDQQINRRGIRVDTTLAENAIMIGDAYKESLLNKAKEISGLDNPNSSAQIKDWLEAQEGVEVLSLNKKAVVDVVANLNREDTKEFMKLREEFSKSSVKKYEAVLRCVCEDGHAHGMFQFAGAGRTARWAGRLIQIQNLPQNHLEDLDSARDLVLAGDRDTFEMLYSPRVQGTLAELIRTVLLPDEGARFIVADFSAIEARVLSWIAGEQWRIDTFKNGGDIYCASASQAFKVPVEKHGVNAHLRQKGKVMELACGYGGGVGAMKAFGADKLGMSEEDMVSVVDKWREASPHVTELWKALEKAAVKCVRVGKPTMSSVGNIVFEMEDGVLWMTLPSGRRIAYWGATIGKDKWGRESLCYMGTDQKTKKWAQLETFGGKLTENLVQATARDVLKNAMLNLNKAGYDIRGHVHDEVIITCPIGKGSLEEVIKLMCTPAPWMDGLPLDADGYECTSYRKA